MTLFQADKCEGNILQENLLGTFTQLFSNLWGSGDGWEGGGRNKNRIRCCSKPTITFLNLHFAKPAVKHGNLIYSPSDCLEIMQRHK